MRQMHLSLMGLALALAGGPAAGLQATACQGLTINSMNFNSGYVIQLVNNPNSVNPNAALNILTAQVANNTAGVLSNPQVTLNLTEPANPDNCAGAQIISTITLTVNKTFQPGQTATLVASDFSGTAAPTICAQFQNDVENQFKSINPDNAAQAITKFLQRRFQVTLTGSCGSSASTFITIFNPAAASKASPAQQLMPRDGSTVTDPLPLFLWTPATAPGTTEGIDYSLILSQSDGGTPLPNGGTISHLPTGQLFYKWQASDPQLPSGKIYWRVQANDHASGGAIGGQGKLFSFDYQPQQAGAGNCGYSLGDLDQYARRQAADKASLLDGLSLQRATVTSPQGLPNSSLADPDVCALLGLAGGSPISSVHLLSLTVTRR